MRHPSHTSKSSLARAGRDNLTTRNDRPGPVVPKMGRIPSLADLLRDARTAEERIQGLEDTKRRTARMLQFENLDQARRIEAAVEQGQSVAAFARQAGIEERRAQRLYKLAAHSGRIRKEVEADEAQHGNDYNYPSWKQFLPREPTEREDGEAGRSTKLLVDDLREQLV